MIATSFKNDKYDENINNDGLCIFDKMSNGYFERWHDNCLHEAIAEIMHSMDDFSTGFGLEAISLQYHKRFSK